MLAFLVCACLAHASTAQNYAERNVVPADTFHTPNTYDEEEEFRFFEEDEETNVYKWNVEEYPHPKNQSRFCNRLKPSHVCDPDGVLTREHADYLDTAIRDLYRETPCICDSCDGGEGGIVVGIGLMKHIYQPYNLHHVKTIRSFTEKLRRIWRLGRCDNDILIVVVTVDRMYYIDVGETTSHYLSVREATEIFVTHKAWFSAGNFFEGLRDILEGYHQEILRKKPKKEEDPGLNVGLVSGVIVGSIAVLGIILFAGFVVYRKCRNDKNESNPRPEKNRNEEISSRSWSKKDIKVLFGSEKRKNPPPLNSSLYQPCRQTDDQKMTPNGDAEEEVIDFTLASPADTSFADETRLTSVTTDSDALEKDLSNAAEDIAKTFPTTKSQSSVLMTDM